MRVLYGWFDEQRLQLGERLRCGVEPANRFYLMNDAGPAFMEPLTASNLSNAHYTLNFTGTGTAMTASALTFMPSFTGVKHVFMDA